MFTRSVSEQTEEETGSQSRCLSSIRYDEEQAQSESAEHDLRSRSGQLLGSKGTRGCAGARPAAATWKWGDVTDSEYDFLCLTVRVRNEDHPEFYQWPAFISPTVAHCCSNVERSVKFNRWRLWVFVGNILMTPMIYDLNYAWLSITCT